jgi:SMODS-associated and fused to various effectors sensor domain
LRSNINLRARVVGMFAHSDANSDFRYDELARQLKVRGLNGLTRAALEQLCREEGLFTARQDQDPAVLSVAVRSFLGPASDIVGASPDNTLLLTDDFRHRYLRDDLDWQADIRPKVEAFHRAKVRESSGRLRLILDAHASIAFLAGATLDLKSGVYAELVQKGRVGARTWRADDGSESSGADLQVSVHELREGRPDIALSISISQSAEPQTRAYVASKLPKWADW